MEATKPAKNYSIPSIDKNGELALFYNLAYNRLCDFIKNTEGTACPGMEICDEIRKKFFRQESLEDRVANNGKDKYQQIRDKDFVNHVLENKTYALIKEFIIKEGTGNINVLAYDIRLINKIILTLLRLRDFHSHILHADTRVTEIEVVDFLNYKLSIAQAAYNNRSEKENRPFQIFETVIINNHPNQKLTDKGVNFFLSFFLPKSFMQLFMAQREYLKRSGEDDTTDYSYHRFLCTFYCLKDGYVNQPFLQLKDKDNLFFEGINIENYLSKQIEAHLQALPGWLIPQISNEHLATTPQKNDYLFTKYIATWLSIKKLPFEWELLSNDYTETNKNMLKKDTGFRPEHNYKKLPAFTTKIEADTPIKVKGGRMRFRYAVEGDTAQIIISKDELMKLGYLSLEDNSRKAALDKLAAFVKGYIGLIKNFDSRRCDRHWYEANKTLIHPVLVTGLEPDKSMDDEAWKKEMTDKIKAKLQKHTEWLGSTAFTNLEQQPTLLFETSEKIKNKLHEKKRADFTEEETAAFKAWLEERKKLKGIRHRKLQVVLFFKDFIMGKNGRFICLADLKNFSRFVYRKDDDALLYDKEKLIAPWLNHRADVFDRKKKDTYNRFTGLNDVIRANGDVNKFIYKFSRELKQQEKKDQFTEFTELLVNRKQLFNNVEALLAFIQEEQSLSGFLQKHGLKRDGFINFIERLFTAKEVDRWYVEYVDLLRKQNHTFDEFFILSKNLFLEKCLETETYLERQSLSALHYVSKLLNIPNTNMHKSRNAFGSRAAEILQPFIATEGDNETYCFSLPNKFFDETENYYNTIDRSFYNQQKQVWKNKISSNATAFFIDKTGAERESREVYNAKKQLHINLLEDNLLHSIYLQLNQHGLGEWAFAGKDNLTNKYNFEWQIDGVTVTANMRELKTNSSLVSASRVRRMLKRIQLEDELPGAEKLIKNKRISYDEIKKKIISHLFDSRWFISKLFELEKQYIGNPYFNNFYIPTMLGRKVVGHVNFKEFKKEFFKGGTDEIRERLKTILGYRDIAYHADILLDKGHPNNYLDYRLLVKEFEENVKKLVSQ